MLVIVALFAFPTSTSLSVRGLSAPAPIGHPLATSSSGASLAPPIPTVAFPQWIDGAKLPPLVQPAGYRGSGPGVLPASGASLANSPSPIPAPQAAPAANVYRTATFIGVVHDSVTAKAIDGALIKWGSQGGICPTSPGNCSDTYSSGPLGNFTIVAPAPQDTIYADYTGYVENFTTVANVTPGQTYDVGIINLTKEGVVTGVIEGSDPTHEKVQCTVLISSVSRSAYTLGPNLTVSTGTFRIPVPPFPSVISFGPKCPQYNSNEYWVNVSAGTVYNMGAVYLPVNVLVQVSVYDAVTKRSLNGQLSEIWVCSYQNPGNCGGKGTTVGTGQPEAWAPPGYDTATVWANAGNGEPGLVNTTMIGFVPALAPGHVFNAGTVYIDDLGLVEIDVGLTYYRALMAQKMTSLWPVGLAYVTPTSLDGYDSWSAYNPMTGNFSTSSPPSSCVGINSDSLIVAPPLRTEISVVPDTAAGECAPAPTWPIPIDLPAWGNATLVNVSPDNRQYSHLGYVNLTPGTYVEGGLYGNAAQPVGQGSGNEQSLISVSSQSTDQNVGLLASRSYTTYVTAQPPPHNEPGFGVAGCVSNSWYIFCVPVPFGPSKITAVGTTVQNFTWVDIPPGFYNGGPMLVQSYDTAPLVHINAADSIVTTGGYGAFDFTNASVSGRVAVQGTGGVPYGLITIRVQSAGSASTQLASSTCTANPITGTFACGANPGWNEITATGPLYLENFTWFDVPSGTANAKVGTIDLTPLTTIQGNILNPTGAGILQAGVQYCAIAAISSCQPLGATGTTNTFGQYSGLVPAYPTPRGDYRVVASATGFSSNWTWVNATVPGGAINASNLTLYSLTSAGGPPSSTPLVPGAAANEWVVGNVIDNVTGLPVQGVAMQWQVAGSFANTVPSTDINSLDDYNTSIPSEIVYLNFSASGYNSTSLFINVTGLDTGGVDYLPTVTMQPETFFRGRAEIGPANWTSISTRLGLGPGDTTVQACTQRLDCGPASLLDEGGFFNITAPTAKNQYEILKFVPKGTPIGSSVGEFNESQATATVSGTPSVVDVADVAILNIFGIAFGIVADQSTNNSTPVEWPTAQISNGPGSINTTTTIAGSGGAVYGILPATAGKNELKMSASAMAYLPEAVTNGTLDWGGATYIGNLSLPHYGWIAGPVKGTGTRPTSIPWAIAGASTSYGKPPRSTSNTGTANGAGYLNMTVPPGFWGNLSISAPDYNQTNVSGFTLNQSTTLSLVSLMSMKGVEGGLTPWGWVLGTVHDTAKKFPLPLASVSVTSRYGATGSPTQTNGNGQYFTDAPPGPSANVSMTLPDYTSNYTRVSVTNGTVVTAHLVNLTGDGIVAGYVLSYPEGRPVAFANVSLCTMSNPLCNNMVVANGSGYFWIAGSPGLDNLTVSYNDFVTTYRPVNVSSDEWTWVGQVNLDEYAYLTGLVIGLPSGIPIGGANVSACSPLAFSYGAVICAYATETSSNGQFTLAIPAANYIIQVNATLYNTTFLPIQLLPGETVSMGLIELEAYGIATGYVFGADTQGPLSGAILTACPTWQSSNCTTANANPKTGQYLFDGPPGPYAVTAAAPHYGKGGLTVKLVSGYLIKAPTIFLQPIGPAYRFTIQGTVLAESTTPGGALVPYSGAVVSDNVGDAASTNATGAFRLSVTWGDIVVTVSANGYRSVQVAEQVRGNITGVSVVLSPTTYNWSGRITDGVNRQPLSGVAITLGPGGLKVATTDPNGVYELALPNGTFDLVAGYSAGSALDQAFPAVAFVLSVNGGGGVHDLAIYPPGRTLVIQVVNHASGLVIPNATVVVSGLIQPEGVGMTVGGSTNLNGSVGISTYTGVYNVTASASGYLTSTVVADTTGENATIAVLVELDPIAAPGASGGGSSVTPVIGAVLAGGVVVLAAGIYLAMRRLTAASRSPPAAPGTPGSAS